MHFLEISVEFGVVIIDVHQMEPKISDNALKHQMVKEDEEI